MTTLEIIIPGPARPCARPRAVHGRMVTPGPTRLYQAAVRGYARTLVPATWDTAAWYRVSVYFCRPHPGDIDNLLKSILDGLQPEHNADGTRGPSAVYHDDSQVIALGEVLILRDAAGPARTHVVIDVIARPTRETKPERQLTIPGCEPLAAG